MSAARSARAIGIPPLRAQATVAVSGAVKDASGGVLPGATVNVVLAGRTVATATAADDGRYQVQVPAGVPFQLTVHLEGFADQGIDMSGVERAVRAGVGDALRGTLPWPSSGRETRLTPAAARPEASRA